MTGEYRPGGYAAIPTWMIRDTSIKRSAVLVYAALSSRGGLGEIAPGQKTLAEEAGVSERTARTALDDLEALGVVEKIKRRGGEGLRTSQNDAYLLHPHGRSEGPAISAGSPEGTGKGDRQMANSTLPIEVTTRGNGDIDTNRYFEAAWKLWPRKTNKVAAKRAFERAVKPFAKSLAAGEVTGMVARALTVAPDYLMATVQRFGTAYADAGTDPQFVPHLATWLNQQRWTDPLPTGQRQQRDTPRDDFGDGNEWMGMAR